MRPLTWLLGVGLLVGCSEVGPALPTPAEASVDVTTAVSADASTDAPMDAPTDAPMDAPMDAPSDVAVEVPAVDRGADTGADAGTLADAAPDAPPLDVTPDAPRTDPAADVSVNVPPLDAAPGSWRSALFPDDWVPVHAGGRADAQGRFLHDFSFAGYHRGDERPPYGRGTVVRTVDARLGDGLADATAAIQADLDAACASAVIGLRVVLVPAGTFRLRFPTPSPATDPSPSPPPRASRSATRSPCAPTSPRASVPTTG